MLFFAWSVSGSLQLAGETDVEVETCVQAVAGMTSVIRVITLCNAPIEVPELR